MSEIDDTEEILLVSGAYNFQGIYVDTLMYPDDSFVQLLNDLEKYLGKPLVCKDDRRYFFSMIEYNNNLRDIYTNEELENIRKEVEAQF